jgi:hypothetical protein
MFPSSQSQIQHLLSPITFALHCYLSEFSCGCATFCVPDDFMHCGVVVFFFCTHVASPCSVNMSFCVAQKKEKKVTARGQHRFVSTKSSKSKASTSRFFIIPYSAAVTPFSPQHRPVTLFTNRHRNDTTIQVYWCLHTTLLLKTYFPCPRKVQPNKQRAVHSHAPQASFIPQLRCL